MQTKDKGYGRQGIAGFSNHAVQKLGDDSMLQSVSEAVTKDY